MRNSSWTSPYALASTVCLLLGSGGFLFGLTNATTLALSEKGYYLTLLVFGLFTAITVQKNVRDREAGLPVASSYVWTTYLAGALALGLLAVGLVNATLALSEKGYYAMSFVLALFSAITLQKQLRDTAAQAPSSHNQE